MYRHKTSLVVKNGIQILFPVYNFVGSYVCNGVLNYPDFPHKQFCFQKHAKLWAMTRVIESFISFSRTDKERVPKFKKKSRII